MYHHSTSRRGSGVAQRCMEQIGKRHGGDAWVGDVARNLTKQQAGGLAGRAGCLGGVIELLDRVVAPPVRRRAPLVELVDAGRAPAVVGHGALDFLHKYGQKVGQRRLQLAARHHQIDGPPMRVEVTVEERKKEGREEGKKKRKEIMRWMTEKRPEKPGQGKQQATVFFLSFSFFFFLFLSFSSFFFNHSYFLSLSVRSSVLFILCTDL